MLTLDLPMTVSGFIKLKSALKNEINKHQVYVHVGDDWPLNNQVLRIGTAKNGTLKRWYATNGHENTFLWSIGESKRYQKSANDYPDYLAFFAGLKGLKTKLCVITYESCTEMYSREREMTKVNQVGTYYPIWESYRDEIKKKYFPINPLPRSKLSDYGGALDLLTRQRNGECPLDNPVPDVLNFRSKRRWDFSLTIDS